VDRLLEIVGTFVPFSLAEGRALCQGVERGLEARDDASNLSDRSADTVLDDAGDLFGGDQGLGDDAVDAGYLDSGLHVGFADGAVDLGERFADFIALLAHGVGDLLDVGADGADLRPQVVHQGHRLVHYRGGLLVEAVAQVVDFFQHLRRKDGTPNQADRLGDHGGCDDAREDRQPVNIPPGDRIAGLENKHQ